MKKYLLWTILFPLMAACTNSREEGIRPDVPIQLTAGIKQIEVKSAVDENSEFEAAIYRWDFRSTDTEWETLLPEEQERTMRVQTGGSIMFVGGNQYFYMTDSEGGLFNSAFKAISPKGTLGTDHEITFSEDQMDGTQDLMVAPLVEVGNSNAPLSSSLIFEHQLAQYNFQAIKRASSEIASITTITLKSVAVPKSINLDDESEVDYAQKEILPLAMPQSATLATDQTVKLGEPMMVAPGNETLSFEITALNTEGETISIPATATFNNETEAGKSYIITIEFAKGEVPAEPVEIDSILATVGAWIPATGGDATFDNE